METSSSFMFPIIDEYIYTLNVLVIYHFFIDTNNASLYFDKRFCVDSL